MADVALSGPVILFLTQEQVTCAIEAHLGDQFHNHIVRMVEVKHGEWLDGQNRTRVTMELSPRPEVRRVAERPMRALRVEEE